MPASVVSAVVSTLASQAVSSIFGGSKQKGQSQTAPAAAAPTPAPVRDEAASAEGRRRTMARRSEKSGRSSTVLSEVGNGNTFG